MKKVIIFHSPLAENAPEDELDVLDQVAFFNSGLKALGYNTEIQPFPYDLLSLEYILKNQTPIFVVNLVETIFSDGRLVHAGPFFFEHFRVPYTGCTADSLYITSNKVLSKKIMQSNGIPTPLFLTYKDLINPDKKPLIHPMLVKSLWEHASYGLDEGGKLLFNSREELIGRFNSEKQPDSFFAEEYIHGREFNLSVIGTKNGTCVLPPAEIQFHYPDDKPRIVGYKAKWEEESFEYKNTIRSFEFSDSDQQLLDELKKITLHCWDVFDLKGYARVDFRVDEKGNIFVLEINANPCISPDSGFVAAAERAGMDNAMIIKNIIEDI